MKNFSVKIHLGFPAMLLILSCCMQTAYAQRKAGKSSGIDGDFRADFRFDHPMHRENFDSTSIIWPVISNSDNLALVQEGEYIIMRKNTQSPFAVLGEFGRDLSDLMISASISITSRSVDIGSAGFLFMAQQEGTGGYVFELNTAQQFRLRQITRSGYRLISGQEKEEGWVKIKQLPVTPYHHFDIRMSGGHYEIRIDEMPVFAFNDPTYQQGAIGLFIGQATLCKVDYLDLYSVKPQESASNVETNGQQSSNQDVVVLTESIVSLRSEVAALKQQNEELVQRIETLKGGDQEMKTRTISLEKRVRELEKQVEVEKKSADSLRTSNAELVRYKKLIEEGGGGDLVITLSKNLKSEKLRSDELELRNKVLQDSLQMLRQEIKQQFNWTPSQEPTPTKDGYSLPKGK